MNNNEKIKTNPGTLDEKQLLKELALDIANKFGIEKQKAESLIKKETLVGIDSLKDELKEEKNLANKDVEKLFFTLKGALEVIEQSSKIEIKTLKDDIEKHLNIEEFERNIESYLPNTLIQKAKNPENIHEHILGFALGTTNSIYSTVEALYKIGKGIIATPLHLYLIVTGKAKTNSFDNI